MRFLTTLLAALPSLATALPTEPVLASVLWSRESGFRLAEGRISTTSDTVARANFTNAINKTGWSYLEVVTQEQFPDKVQAFAAGYLEGYTTSELLYLYWKNTVERYCEGKERICQSVANYVRENTAWVKRQVSKKRKRSAYWHQVGLFYDQYEGLVHGYDAAAKKDRDWRPIPRGDIFWMNIFGDLFDFEKMYAEANDTSMHMPGPGHCSALIKVLPSNSELLLRYNDYRHDPLSRCDCSPDPFSADNAISARNDLNPAGGRCAIPEQGHNTLGGIDMKLTAASMIDDLEFVAVGGPTYDDVPAFRWSEVDFAGDVPHFGQPDLWKFEPVQHQWAMK